MKINATRKGLITGCVMIVLSLISFYVLKFPAESRFQYINYIIYSLGIAWSIMDFARYANPETAFREYFSTGFKTFIVVTLLVTIYTLIFYSIHTEIRDAQIAANSQLLIQQRTHTAPEIADNAKQMKAIFIPGKLAATSFFYLFLGAIITVLYSVMIIKKIKK